MTEVAMVETKVTIHRPRKKLPKGMPDAVTTIFKKCFKEGEGVRIALPRETGIRRGACKSVDEWLDMYGSAGEDMFGSKGTYICVNPLLIGGIADKDVIDYRHCLVEFDDGALEEQYAVLRESGLPLSALIYSGGKSMHGWVKVGARDRQSFDERVKEIYKSMERYRVDGQNKNPSRLSRYLGFVGEVRCRSCLGLILGLSLTRSGLRKKSQRGLAASFGLLPR